MSIFTLTSWSRILMAVVALGTVSTVSAAKKKNSKPGRNYYTQGPLLLPAPKLDDRKDWNVKNLGPVGIGINLKRPDLTMVIANVEKGSPAEKTGKLKKGQIIESINGKVLKDIDPREILGDIITDAEASDGKVTLKIKDLGTVTVTIPVMGTYSETWPINCSKSDKIVRNLADLLATQEKPRWGSALFLLSTGEEKDLAVVRKWMTGKEKIGTYPWHAGYLGIAACEYYLRTGDESILPAIKEMGEELKRTMYNGGWSGRGHGSNFTYSTGTGQMHAAGVHCITFLMLAKMCGVELNDYMFQKSLKTFYRFAGHENVPYGDGWPEGGFRDNGKSAGLAVAMAAAARLTPDGESSVYAKARDNVAMKSFYATNWFHSAHTGGGIGEIWHHSAMSLMHKKRPTQYRTFLDTRRWVMELSRRFDGGIGIAGVTDRYDRSATEQERSWGTYFALTYTLPREKLIVFGAPKTNWCKTYKLPERPWGRPADDAFVSPDPVPNGPFTTADLQKETAQHESSLPLMRRIGAADATDALLLKYLHHPEMGIRTATMRKLVANGRAPLVTPLLKSEDPRLRHAGVLAVSGMFKGGSLPTDQVTPEMFDLIGKMIEDPKESLWVVQQAMLALKRANPDVIAKHRATLLNYLKHDDWFLRTRAVSALEPICIHEAHYQAVLPPMIKTLSEFTTSQALNPGWSMEKTLGRAKPPVKAFAFDELKKAYASVPQQMTFPGGRVIPNGSRTVRGMLAKLMGTLPNGSNFVKTRPMMTLAAAQSGKDSDKYRYSGTFTPKKGLAGTWAWVLWPAPKNPKEIDSTINKWLKTWVKNGRKPVNRPKDTLQLSNGGKVAKSNYFKGHFWSGDMLINPGAGQALKMTIRTVDGIDFLLVEKGGFDKSDGSKNWHCGYHGYVSVDSLKSHKGSKARKKK